MNNIDVFNCAAMEIFHLCLENFPIQLNVEPTEIALEVSKFFQLSENNQRLQDEFSNIDLICQHALWWLRDENYIRISSQTMDGSCSIVMTEKGLNAINKSPEALENKKSFKDIFYNGFSTLPFTVASGVMTEFFKNSN